MELTFAYGMNMYPDAMPEWAVGRKAWLPGYRLAWRGYADVEEHPGAVVPGVLWQLEDHDLHALDVREGVPHLYGRKLVEVTVADPDGDPATELAWVYQMNAATVAYYAERRLGGLATCSDHYLWMVERGRHAFGHPADDVRRM